MSTRHANHPACICADCRARRTRALSRYQQMVGARTRAKMEQDISTYPPEHDTDSENCWCQPEVLQPCPECPFAKPNSDCWKCNGRGLVPEFDAEAPSVIVHRAKKKLVMPNCLNCAECICDECGPNDPNGYVGA